jgi:hypothetical protein
MEVMAQPARALAAPVAEYTSVAGWGKEESTELLDSNKAVSGYYMHGLRKANSNDVCITIVAA